MRATLLSAGLIWYVVYRQAWKHQVARSNVAVADTVSGAWSFSIDAGCCCSVYRLSNASYGALEPGNATTAAYTPAALVRLVAPAIPLG